MNKDQPLSLEQRITGILKNENASAAELSELVAQAERDVAAADQEIAQMRERASDLIVTPDADAARQAVLDADLRKMQRDRINNVLPRLRDKLAEALSAEACDKWLAEYKRVKVKLAEAAALFKSYTEHAQAIADIFALAEQIDHEVDQLNIAAPAALSMHPRLRHVELESRDLDRFTRDNPSLADNCELRDWDCSCLDLWPPRSLKTGNTGGLAVLMATSMLPAQHPDDYTGDWWKAAQAREAARRENKQMADYYREQTEAQEKRLNDEEAERFRQQHPTQR
jgi:hypothetical protein